jgi:hypothetical protein
MPEERKYKPEEKQYKVVALGDGRFRLTTTTTWVEEQDVDEGQLLALGLRPPVQVAPVHAADRAAALQYWTEHLGGYDPRLSGRINGILGEFGLETIKQLIRGLASQNVKGGAGVKYAQFIRVLRLLREENER